MAAKKWTLATVHTAEDNGGNILGVFETSALASDYMLEQKIAGKQVARPGMIEDGDERVFVNNVIFEFCKAPDKPKHEDARVARLQNTIGMYRKSISTSLGLDQSVLQDADLCDELEYFTNTLSTVLGTKRVKNTMLNAAMDIVRRRQK